MQTLFIILIILSALLLILLVLVQNSKGGGLAQGFSSGNSVLGAPKTTDFLEKLTWGLAIALVVLSLIATITIHSGRSASTQKNAVNAEQVELPSAAEAMGGQQAPSAPAPAPEQ